MSRHRNRAALLIRRSTATETLEPIFVLHCEVFARYTRRCSNYFILVPDQDELLCSVEDGRVCDLPRSISNRSMSKLSLRTVTAAALVNPSLTSWAILSVSLGAQLLRSVSRSSVTDKSFRCSSSIAWAGEEAEIVGGGKPKGLVLASVGGRDSDGLSTRSRPE